MLVRRKKGSSLTHYSIGDVTGLFLVSCSHINNVLHLCDVLKYSSDENIFRTSVDVRSNVEDFIGADVKTVRI